MDNNEVICDKCSKKVSAGDLKYHGVRRGYSAAHFPLIYFEKVPLCPACLERQGKIEKFEKVLALVALAIVGYFMAIGFLASFSSFL
ncbi:MAG: hypothetical protein ACQES4_09670 [Bacillota bacterium]